MVLLAELLRRIACGECEDEGSICPHAIIILGEVRCTPMLREALFNEIYETFAKAVV